MLNSAVNIVLNSAVNIVLNSEVNEKFFRLSIFWLYS